MKKDGISIVIAYNNRHIQFYRSLKSINKTKFKKDKLEIIVVDDNSMMEERVDDIVEMFPQLNIKLFRVTEKQKKWIGPSPVYNIGLNHVSYDKVLLQNCEIYHRGDVIQYTARYLSDDNYLSYACYSLTMGNTIKNDYKNVQIKNVPVKSALDDGWYNHSVYRPKYFYMCAALSYDNICRLNGFDERYKDGIAFDDNEFIERIRRLGLDMKIVDEPYVLHQAHTSPYHFDANTPKEKKDEIVRLFNKNKQLLNDVTLKETTYRASHNEYFNCDLPS